MQIIHDQTARDLLGEAAIALDPDALRRLSDCVVMLDAEGKVVQISDGSLKVLKANDEDGFIGCLWWTMWPEGAQGPLEEAVMRGLTGHITQYWTHYVHDDGSISQWDIRLTPLYDAAHEVKSVIAVSRNLTTH